MDSSWDYKKVKIWSLTGSIYAIMSIFLSGWCFKMFTETTSNSDIFAHYLVKMNDWIYNNSMFGYNFFKIILIDNILNHKSNR